jgi:hypothetical protein
MDERKLGDTGSENGGLYEFATRYVDVRLAVCFG